MWGGDIETKLVNMPRDSRTVACFENLQLAIKTKLQGYKELNEPFPNLPTREWEMNDWEKHLKQAITTRLSNYSYYLLEDLTTIAT